MKLFAHRHLIALGLLASLIGVNAYAIEAAPPGVDRGAAPKPLPPGGGPNGEQVFKDHCAQCHETGKDRAPSKAQLKNRWPDEVVSALTTGVMKVNGVDAGLTIEQIDAVATYLTGARPPRPIPIQFDSPSCPPAHKHFSLHGPSWNGWSTDADNLRFQKKPHLSVKDIPKLKVKWAFTYIGGRYGQPTIVGGRVFAASSSGKVYSLDAKTGCTYWRFDAPVGVRTTVVVGKNSAAPSGYAAYFGSYDKVYYAVDAVTGVKLWETVIDTYLRQVLTGGPVLYKDMLYAPVSAWEEVGTAVGTYQCCRARGSVVALDVKTGKIVWKTYTLPEAKPFKKNSEGTQMWGPAGASIWSTPTVDKKRKQLYITTGDTFVEMDEDGSDSVMALDLETGAVRWKHQLSKGDWYLAGCPRVKNAKSPANCPEKNGPDSDFGSSAFLVKGPHHKDVLIAGQKSSKVYALDPDNGDIVWETKVGKGSALGGVQWGMATDKKQIYVAVADLAGGKPGIHALDPKTGKEIWYTKSPKVRCAWNADGKTEGTLCLNANSQAPSAIPGAVFAGTIDGHLRAYNAKTGEIFWDFDTAAYKYDTINGSKQLPGGSLDAGGATIVDGMVYVMSGYTGVLGGVLENVLVAFSVDGK